MIRFREWDARSVRDGQHTTIAQGRLDSRHTKGLRMRDENNLIPYREEYFSFGDYSWNSQIFTNTVSNSTYYAPSRSCKRPLAHCVQQLNPGAEACQQFCQARWTAPRYHRIHKRICGLTSWPPGCILKLPSTSKSLFQEGQGDRASAAKMLPFPRF